jgi:hypothetical protein
MKTYTISAIILVIILALGGWVYMKNNERPTSIPGRNDDSVLCTADVKECPDGSFVSRIPPSCAFAECSKGTGSKTIELE